MSRVRECGLQTSGRRIFQTEKIVMTQEAMEFVYEKSRSPDFQFVVPHVKILEVATLS